MPAFPRCVTCWASSRIDSCVIARPRSRSSHKERASLTASSSPRSRPLSIACRTNALWSGVRCTSICRRERARSARIKRTYFRSFITNSRCASSQTGSPLQCKNSYLIGAANECVQPSNLPKPHFQRSLTTYPRFPQSPEFPIARTGRRTQWSEPQK